MERRIEHVTTTQAVAGLSRVRARVKEAAARSGRSEHDVTVLAAVKYVDSASCAALVQAGVVDLAENRLSQLTSKQDELAGAALDTASWHFIGRLQSREAPVVAARTSMIHSLASMSAARRLDSVDAHPQLLVQVNVDGDPAKDGVPAGELERFLLDLPQRVRVGGLMTMPAFTPNPELSRPTFTALRELQERLATRMAGRHDLRWLSMGTSQDFAVAVEEGATHVRLGRILFGHVE